MLITFTRRAMLAGFCSLALISWTSSAFAQDEELPPSPPTGEIVGDTGDEESAEAPAAAAPGELDAGAAITAEPIAPQPSPDLFYNYYAQPGLAGGVPAAMYLSPRPVPPLVGHTYYTYQPFLPHEWMYPHYREYYNYQSVYQGGGVGYDSYNKTTVVWDRGNFRPTSLRHFWNGRAPHRQYRRTGYGLPGAAGFDGECYGAHGTCPTQGY